MDRIAAMLREHGSLVIKGAALYPRDGILGQSDPEVIAIWDGQGFAKRPDRHLLWEVAPLS